MDASIPDLLLAGVRLMFVGMTIVYLFLALLVWVIGFSARMMHRYTPEEPESMSAALGSRESEHDHGEVVVAITAALHRHQNN